MKWIGYFFVIFFIVLTVPTYFIKADGEMNLSQVSSQRKEELHQKLDETEDRVVVFIIDGTHEEIFRELLNQGDLPHIERWLKPQADGKVRGVYTAATSVWPSTTGPAYAPFVAGVHPAKGDVAGIRAMRRESKSVRTYPGIDLFEISGDFARDVATIYEVLGAEETFSQVGFITRRGWDDQGNVLKPPHENIVSWVSSLSQLGKKGDGLKLWQIDQDNEPASADDVLNAWSLILSVTPKGAAEKYNQVFQGHYYQWETLRKWARWFEPRNLFDWRRQWIRQQRGYSSKLRRMPLYTFFSLHLPDKVSHASGVGDDYIKAIKKCDEIIGYLAGLFQFTEPDKKFTFFVSADHGSSSVNDGEKYHVRVVKNISQKTGLYIYEGAKRWENFVFNLRMKTSWPSWFGLKGEVDGVSAVSGNAHVQIYLKKPGSTNWLERPTYSEMRSYPKKNSKIDLVKELLQEEAVDNVYLVDWVENRSAYHPGRYHIFKRRNSQEDEFSHAVISYYRDLFTNIRWYKYEVLEGDDPLEYQFYPEIQKLIDEKDFFDSVTWAKATRNSKYPDGIYQIVQLLNAPEAGDIIFDAKPGYEPWDEGQAGLHGSLRREHINVPMLIYSPHLDLEKAKKVFVDHPPRTVDIYSMTLDILGIRRPSKISWKLWTKEFPESEQVRSANVRTDIDGVGLDIWENKEALNSDVVP